MSEILWFLIGVVVSAIPILLYSVLKQNVLGDFMVDDSQQLYFVTVENGNLKKVPNTGYVRLRVKHTNLGSAKKSNAKMETKNNSIEKERNYE